MSFVKMPQDDYVAMCNKLRSMLNETDKYTSKDFIEKMDELILPNLDEMDFGSNSSLPEKGNSNPQYYEDIAKAINEIKQADAVVLEELNVTESKKYTAPSGIAYSSVNVDIEEGGNPNHVEIITGTLANPWGGMQISTLRNEIQNNNATAYIDFKDGTGDIRIFLRYNSAFFGGDCSTIFGAALSASYYIQYNNTGAVSVAKKFSSNGTATNISNSTATTLTIIHHPLPDSGT